MKRAILELQKQEGGEARPQEQEVGEAKRRKIVPSRNKVHPSKNTGAEVWNNTEYSVFAPWRTDAFEVFCRDSGIKGDYYTPKNFSMYKSMIRRVISKNDTTPGSVAVSELMLQSEKKCYQKYLHNFIPEWDTTVTEKGIEPRESSFVSGMYQTALCSTKFMVSILEHWTDWCKKHNMPRGRRSFYLFATSMEADNRISSGVFHHTYTFVYAFSHLFTPDQRLPSTAPSTASNEPPPPDHEMVTNGIPHPFETPFETLPPPVSEEALNKSFEEEPLLFDPKDDFGTAFTDEEIKEICFGGEPLKHFTT